MASKTNTAVAPDMAELFGAFLAFVQEKGETPATPAPARKARKTVDAKLTPQHTGKRSTTPARKAGLKRTVSGVITCGMAWELLGADPTYTPSNPAAPARNAQLWALNSKGLLAIKS
jgi:hypothetical protein